jgi:hypothetical protein
MELGFQLKSAELCTTVFEIQLVPHQLWNYVKVEVEYLLVLNPCSVTQPWTLVLFFSLKILFPFAFQYVWKIVGEMPSSTCLLYLASMG